MAHNSRGTHNPTNPTRKRPFTNEHPTQHEFVDSNPLGIQPSNSANSSNKPSPSTKRKRQQPPTAFAVATSSANNTNTVIGPSNAYINLPHKMPSQRSVPAFLHKLYKYVFTFFFGISSLKLFRHWIVKG